jgi:hypothetical protein
VAFAGLCFWVSSSIKPKNGHIITGFVAAQFFGLYTLRIKLCYNKLRLTQGIISIDELVLIVGILGFLFKFWK